MSLPKLQKLYFPGLISLVFLPLMCICYFFSNNAFHKYRVMRIATANRETINKWISRPGKKLDIENFRKYKILNITGNLPNDIQELSKLKILLNRLKLEKDTVNGVKVSIGNHAQYGEVVSALDLCSQGDKNSQLWFYLMSDQILIGHVPSLSKYKSISRPYIDLANDVIIYKTKKPFISLEMIENGMIYLYTIILRFWPSGLILIVMFWFAFFKKKRYFNINTFQSVGDQSLL